MQWTVPTQLTPGSGRSTNVTSNQSILDVFHQQLPFNPPESQFSTLEAVGVIISPGTSPELQPRSACSRFHTGKPQPQYLTATQQCLLINNTWLQHGIVCFMILFIGEIYPKIMLPLLAEFSVLSQTILVRGVPLFNHFGNSPLHIVVWRGGDRVWGGGARCDFTVTWHLDKFHQPRKDVSSTRSCISFYVHRYVHMIIQVPRLRDVSARLPKMKILCQVISKMADRCHLGPQALVLSQR